MSDNSSRKIEEDKYRVLIDNAPEAVVILDMETGKFVDFNRNAMNYFHLSKEELLRKGPIDLSPVKVGGQDAATYAQNLILEAFNGGNPVFDWVHLNSKGDEIPCEVRLIRFPPYDKKLVRASIIDKSEQKKIEKELQTVEDRLKYLTENLKTAQQMAKMGSYEVDYLTQDAWYSEEFYAILEMSPEENLGSEEFLQLAHPEDRELLVQNLNKCIEQCLEQRIEHRLLFPNGKLKYLSNIMRPITNEEGKLIRINGILQDITDRKQVEQELSELTSRFQISTKAAKVGIWDWDLVSNFLIWDDTMYGLYGLSNTGFPITYESWKAAVHPDDLMQSEIEVEMALQGKKEFNSEFRVIWSDQSIHHIKALGTVQRNPEGAPIRMIGTNWDITKEKEAELQKIRARQLELKNKELEQFAYVASHDLKEPLRTIIGFVGLLKLRFKEQLDEEANQHLEFISQAGNRMNRLIKALLDYTRIGANRQLTTVDCNKLVQNVRTDLASQISDSQTQFKIEALPNIQGYQTELRMLFQNLISNAIKFRKKDSLSIVSISAKKEKDHWEFCVADNGIGIDLRYKEKIFAIFQRLESRGIYEGTGIGLAHCQKIVDLHGGNIWVESQPGEGSKFFFTIPEG